MTSLSEAPLYDIADSAHWYNKPDFGILIWRDSPESGKPTQIAVAKSRYHVEITLKRLSH